MKKMKAFIQRVFSLSLMLINTFFAILLLGASLLVMAVLVIISEALLPEKKESKNSDFSPNYLSVKESKELT